MKKLSTPLVLALVAVLGAGALQSAGAQDAAKLRRAKAALPGTAAQSLDRTVASAKSRGLPTDPLLDKVLEGAAKNVPPDRILAVVQQLSDRLGTAHALLGRGAPTSDIAAVADALQRGVPDHAVRSIQRGARKGEPLAPSVHAMADLVERGVPANGALEVLGAWRKRGHEVVELTELPPAVERLIRRGIPPEQAAASVASAVGEGRRPENAPPPAVTVPPGKKQGRADEKLPIPPGKAKGAGRKPGGSH
jgi:hypothetical protein